MDEEENHIVMLYSVMWYGTEQHKPCSQNPGRKRGTPRQVHEPKGCADRGPVLATIYARNKPFRRHEDESREGSGGAGGNSGKKRGIAIEFGRG